MEGIIYYNIGLKCLVRLAVSISTLVRNTKKSITLLSDVDGYEACKEIAEHFKIEIKKISFGNSGQKNSAFLNKCRMHAVTPYDKTIFLDSDTIVLKAFDECFGLLDAHEFIVPQFANWASNRRPYYKRIMGWKPFLDSETMKRAFDEPRAVNIGFYGWQRGAQIFELWYDLAIKNSESFIPDEISCQILLPKVPHLVIGNEYNTSCKHDKTIDNAKTLHYHGKKHCRIQDGKYLYHSDLWYSEFDKIASLPFVVENIQHDPKLRRNIALHRGMK